MPCGLKIAALFESALSNVLDNSALENLARAGRGDTNDPRIDANARTTLRVWNILCSNQMQIPDSTFARDCGRWLDFPRPVEILPVIVGEDQVNSGSALKRAQRGVLPDRVLTVSVRASYRIAAVSFHRWRLVFFSLVSFRNYIASGANKISRKFRQLGAHHDK